MTADVSLLVAKESIVVEKLPNYMETRFFVRRCMYIRMYACAYAVHACIDKIQSNDDCTRCAS